MQKIHLEKKPQKTGSTSHNNIYGKRTIGIPMETDESLQGCYAALNKRSSCDEAVCVYRCRDKRKLTSWCYGLEKQVGYAAVKDER